MSDPFLDYRIILILTRAQYRQGLPPYEFLQCRIAAPDLGKPDRLKCAVMAGIAGVATMLDNSKIVLGQQGFAYVLVVVKMKQMEAAALRIFCN